MSIEEKVEGIVLKAIPFKEQDRIVTLYTKEQGTISLYVRGLSKKKPTLTNLTTPLSRGEFLFRKGKNDLHTFIDGTIFDLHLNLRTSYKHMETGGKFLQAIHHTQLPCKKAPSLYALLASFLKKLGAASFPETLWASFQLKLLTHEGLLCLDQHRSFSETDWKLLVFLTHARQFDPLLNLELPSSLLKEIEALFATLIS